MEQCEDIEDVSTDTGNGSDSGSSIASAPSIAVDDGLAPAEVEPGDLYDEFAMECDPVPAVAGHTTRVLDGPSTSADDIEMGDLVPSDSEDEARPPLIDSDSEDDRPVRKSCLRAASSVPVMPTIKSRRRRQRYMFKK